MRKILALILFLFLAKLSFAQCVAEVKSVIQDPVRGSIIVETQYKLNGVVVDVRANPDPNAIGRTRYLETSGVTIQDIVDKAKADINQHCENLIIRNAANVNNLNTEKLNIQKALTSPIITQMQNAVGWTKQVDQKVIQYKGKEITIEADGSYSVVDIP